MRARKGRVEARLGAGAVAVAAVLGVIAVTTSGMSGSGGLGVAALMTAAQAVTWARPGRVQRGEQVQSLHVDDCIIVVMLMLGATTPLLGALLIGTAIGVSFRPSPMARKVFNVGQTTAAASIAVLAYGVVSGASGHTGSLVAASVIGGLAFWSTSMVAVAIAMRLSQGQPIIGTLSDDLSFRLLYLLTSVSVGLLVGLAGRRDLWAVFLTVLPLAVVREALEGHQKAQRDRERIRGLQSATTKAYESIRLEGVEAAVISSAKDLMRCAAAGISSSPPEQALRARLTNPGERRWLWVDGKWNQEAFDDDEAELLEALASMAAGALENATLLQEIQEQAFHDSMTGLPNHVLFEQRLHVALSSAQRTHTLVAVVFVDLDRFKGVNDTLGHQAGDELLTAVARRLEEHTRSGDMVARLGGDEFTLLWSGLADPDDARWRCETLAAALREPIRVAGQTLFATASIGVALYPNDADSAGLLIKRADAAMYEAKRAGRNGYRFWVRAHDAGLRDVRQEGELHEAIDSHQLTVHYQPIVDLLTGRVAGAEALARWNHPEHGLLPPDRFVPLAEDVGLVTLIDGFVLQRATEQLAAWDAAGHPPINVAVNVSAHRFEDLGFATVVAEQLDRTGLSGHRLSLEMTESIGIQDPSDTLRKLHELGIRIVLDDFGTGYSMLSRLRRLPIDALKIDRSFLAEDGDASQELVATIVAMGLNLGLDVVAEGVESAEHHRMLRRLGCGYGQGFFYAQPMPPAELIEFVQRSDREPVTDVRHF